LTRVGHVRKWIPRPASDRTRKGRSIRWEAADSGTSAQVFADTDVDDGPATVLADGEDLNLGAQRAVEALDLAGGGRARRGEAMGDAVLPADLVEQNPWRR
jgi:hypothetical protein